MRAAKVQASLHIRAVSPEPSLLAHISSESRGTFRQKARSLALLNGWACAVKIVMTECSKTQIRLTGLILSNLYYRKKVMRLWIVCRFTGSILKKWNLVMYVLKQHSYLKNSAWKLLWRLRMPTNSQIYGEGTLSKIALWCYVIRLGNLDLSIKNLDETETI